ncbi:hypothetical protein KRMM14A1259_41020 [Krasilnikovia sp. MM14-A1259]
MWGMLVVPVALVSGVTVASGAALAVPSAAVAADAGSSTNDRYKQLVRRLMDKDPRWEVRSAARSAFVSDNANAATAFFASGGGYEAARDRASKNASRNDLIISRTIATTTEQTSPIVHLTAIRASHGTLDEKDRYVRTGLKEAQDLDAKHSPVERAKQQAQQDRDYVADLALHAAGPWVRAAAQRAVDVGTNDEIAEFFKYSWASAADCDQQAHRMDAAEQDMRFRHRLDQLVVTAQQAQEAYLAASGAAKDKAAEEARSAWQGAADLANTTQASWEAEQQLAATQAQEWARVHDFALTATTGQDWKTIAARAEATGGSWAEELAWAQDQSRQWTELSQAMLANAMAIPVPAPSSSAPAGA